MKRRGMVGVIFLVLLLIIALVVGLTTLFILRSYVLLNWQLYPKGEALLDLREQAITCQEYDELSRKLPDTEILWSVPFQNAYYTNHTEELTVTWLTDSDVNTLQYLPALKTLHAEACVDYPQLMDAARRYPNVDVRYLVKACGQEISAGTDAITVNSLTEDDVKLLQYLPALTSVNAVGCSNLRLLEQVEKDHPEWNLTYMSEIAGVKINPDAKKLEVTGAEYSELKAGMAAMPQLKEVMIHSPKADGESLLALREEYPNVTIHWDVVVREETLRDDVTELDLSSAPLESIDEAKEIAAKFPLLTTLVVDSGSIPNEEMAEYREEVRSSYKVVWTVTLGPICKLRTDALYFMPIQQGEYYLHDSGTENLKYCEDIICVDVGHHALHNIDFVRYMPHLKYLILADTQITSPDGLEDCKELVYLEVDHSAIRNYAPIVGCTALEDLNINDTYGDITPLLEMTWLKNLWAPGRGYTEQQLLIEALPDTHLSLTGANAPGEGWRNLDNYYAMRDVLGMPYMD